MAAAHGWRVPRGLRTTGIRPSPPDPGFLSQVAGLADEPSARGPEDLGRIYEAALAPEARSAGAHYTPDDLARRLVDLVIGPSRLGAGPRVWDPACGGGAFLLAAADALLAAGGEPAAIVRDQLWGTDIDPGAIAVAEAALCWWAELHGAVASPGAHLAVADPLLDESPLGLPDDSPLAVAASAGFDVVVGNPPFQGQLTGGSVRSPARTAALRARWGTETVQPYTDTATLFLVAGARALAPGGRLVMILPSSTLAARDAASARAAASEIADLTGLWVAGELVFGAAVLVCGVVLERRAATATALAPGRTPADPTVPRVPEIRRWKGRSVTQLSSVADGSVVGAADRTGTASSWARYALAALGVPDPRVRSAGQLGSMVTARAGFRDEYYGLVGHVIEGPAGSVVEVPEGLSPLITAGLIDPGSCAWGRRSARFGGERFDRPVVDRASLAAAGGRAAAWVAGLSVPKVVVATQTRVGEAAVDDAGTWVASTPTIAIVAEPARLWLVAAVICSPVGSIAALAATAGTARAGDAIRHGVASIAGLPLPVDAEAWAAGADALRAGDRDAFVATMAAAYGLEPGGQADDWWHTRAPRPT